MTTCSRRHVIFRQGDRSLQTTRTCGERGRGAEHEVVKFCYAVLWLTSDLYNDLFFFVCTVALQNSPIYSILCSGWYNSSLYSSMTVYEVHCSLVCSRRTNFDIRKKGFAKKLILAKQDSSTRSDNCLPLRYVHGQRFFSFCRSRQCATVCESLYLLRCFLAAKIISAGAEAVVMPLFGAPVSEQVRLERLTSVYNALLLGKSPAMSIAHVNKGYSDPVYACVY